MTDDFVDLKCKDDEGRDVWVFKGPSRTIDETPLYEGDFVAFVEGKPVKTTIYLRF